jgi:hypoxanthine phosphoribosyltransferase
MIKKEFISFDTVRNNAIILAARIYREFGIPDIIYVSLRGGAAMGNVISEYFKIVSKSKKVFYAAVVARAYQDIFQCGKVEVDGWTYNPERLKKEDRILLIDDIYDTGRTINHLVGQIMENGIVRKNIAVVVHDYKLRTYLPAPEIQPDFFCRKHVVSSPEEDFWIYYLSHELKSLTEAELAEHYIKSDDSLKAALDIFKNQQL